jgi:hypothetical protein
MFCGRQKLFDALSGMIRQPGEHVGEPSLRIDVVRCFLRLANLPNFALDRLSRYEATLWRQASQILFALDALDRRKPQDRGRRFSIGSRLPADGRDDY